LRSYAVARSGKPPNETHLVGSRSGARAHGRNARETGSTLGRCSGLRGWVKRCRWQRVMRSQRSTPGSTPGPRTRSGARSRTRAGGRAGGRGPTPGGRSPGLPSRPAPAPSAVAPGHAANGCAVAPVAGLGQTGTGDEARHSRGCSRSHGHRSPIRSSMDSRSPPSTRPCSAYVSAASARPWRRSTDAAPSHSRGGTGGRRAAAGRRGGPWRAGGTPTRRHRGQLGPVPHQ